METIFVYLFKKIIAIL